MTNQLRPLYSPEAERAVLGCVLLDITTLGEMRLTTADFHVQRHRWIFEAARSCASIGAADAVTVARELERRGQAVESGGLAYLIECVTAAPSVAHATAYAETVRRDADSRRLLEIGSAIAKSAYSSADPIQEAARFAQDLDSLARSSAVAIMATAQDAANEFYANFEHWVKTREIPGVPTYFKSLDVLGGMRRRELMVIAARPGMGKSSLAGTISLAQARHGKRISVCSLEMSKAVWMEQALLSDLMIDKRRAGPRELELVREAALRAQDLPLRFYDRGYCTPNELEHNVRLHARDLGGLDVVWIDHLGYIDHVDKGNVAFNIGVTTKRLARLAKELDCAVVALCQLNRLSEMTQREPTLIDLRDSGEIEQDARQVWFLHRPEYRDLARTPDQAEECKVIVAKNSSGATGVTRLAFVRAYRRFAEYAPGEKAAVANGRHRI